MLDTEIQAEEFSPQIRTQAAQMGKGVRAVFLP